MSHRLIHPDSYLKRAKKILKKHPEIRSHYQKTPGLLELPYHPSLRLHRLQGRLAPLSSVSINVSYRIMLETLIRNNDIIQVAVGDRAYRSKRIVGVFRRTSAT